jgi:hypothetical protein
MKSNTSTLSLIKEIIYEDENLETFHILETILAEFIPFFNEINSSTHDKKVLRLANDLIYFVSNTKNSKKKKNTCDFTDNNFKYEEREFLYKTYVSSSDKNESNNIKIFCEDCLRISNLTTHVLRGFLILLKEEIGKVSVNTTIPGKEIILLDKLKTIKKLVINENKLFDYKLLFIFLNFVVLKFCSNLEEIIFEGIFYSRIDQIDIMLKNGVYLHFINKNLKIKNFVLTNKLEFLNENVAFKHLYEYCYKNNINDIDADTIDFKRINIFTVLASRTNIESFEISKTTIDKNSSISCLIDIVKKNIKIKNFSIDKFVSIPETYKKELYGSLKNLEMLKSVKIIILSSDKEDLELSNIGKYNHSVRKIGFKFFKLNSEYTTNEDILQKKYFNFSQTKLERISLRFDKMFTLSYHTFFPSNLIELSLGYIDQTFLEQFVNIPSKYIISLRSLKFCFFENDDHEQSYRLILKLVENLKLVKFFIFENFYLNYKNICDEDIKKLVSENSNLRKLVISTPLPFHIQYIEGLYYFDYPKYLTGSILFSLKLNKTFNKIYPKKNIVDNILQFQRIKKEKLVVVSYKI